VTSLLLSRKSSPVNADGAVFPVELPCPVQSSKQGCLRGASIPLSKNFPLSLGRGVRKVKPLWTLLLLVGYSDGSNSSPEPDETGFLNSVLQANILPPMISLLVLVDKRASFLLLKKYPAKNIMKI
jgi:hypothetical protein